MLRIGQIAHTPSFVDDVAHAIGDDIDKEEKQRFEKEFSAALEKEDQREYIEDVEDWLFGENYIPPFCYIDIEGTGGAILVDHEALNMALQDGEIEEHKGDGSEHHGLTLFVNDHGNMTLYDHDGEGGYDPVWSVV